jgi:uncharacterized protein YndB with AHSA1/START domain
VADPARAEVSTHIAAPPERVYDLVADVTRMGEWSPETISCEWLDGASRAEPGAWFAGTNRARATWTTRCHVDVADPGRELAFTVHAGGRPSSRWRYRFEPDGDGGTIVTESMEGLLTYSPAVRLLKRVVTGVGDRSAHNAEGMRRTLARLKAVAES